ncbi:MAG: hypothetical protein ACR2MX_11605 [Cyclobacteriaceae bacterium]
MMKRYLVIYVICLLFTGGSPGFGQQILLDRGVQVEGLWCFPLFTDSLTYQYLPNHARLALDESQKPQFSFLRYVINEPRENTSAATIQEADGGAILHFLVLYETQRDQITKAQQGLRALLDNDQIRLVGPVLFDHGRYALVSSILNPANGSEEQKLLAVGEAPVLEGSRIALTFELDPQRSKLLLETFKMSTPDVSLVFDLTFSGLSENYSAKLEVDWSQVQKHQSFETGGTYYFVSADIEAAFDEMMRENAIKLTTAGNDEAMEGLLNTVYNKLLELMFDPIPPESVPENEQLMESLGSLISRKGILSSGKTVGFGAHMGYKHKQVKTGGKSVLLFNGRSTSQRHHFITFNAGNLYHQYGKDSTVFKDVPLWDPTFQQREIFVAVDGSLENEFDWLLNSVTVTLNKKHESGKQTVKELILKRQNFADYDGTLSMVYGADQDFDRNQWLEYVYQANWQFQGGGSYQTDWIPESGSMINLYTPFKRHTIELEGDTEILRTHQIRAVVVQIKYAFFDQEKTARLTIKPGEPLKGKEFEITLPIDQSEVSYNITWIKQDGSRLAHQGTDQFGLIFIDELQDAITN